MPRRASAKSCATVREWCLQQSEYLAVSTQHAHGAARCQRAVSARSARGQHAVSALRCRDTHTQTHKHRAGSVCRQHVISAWSAHGQRATLWGAKAAPSQLDSTGEGAKA